ncbi:MAG: hypothetical protein ACRDHP_16990, partial [Ktedonobacterales bacterium]
MSQSTLDPNLAPEGAAVDPSVARPGTAPRRRRRSTSHKPAAPRPEQATSAEPNPVPEAPAVLTVPT